MEIRSYNAELAYANMMFARLFNNIQIERQMTNKETKQKENTIIPVKCVFGQRSRVLKNLQNPDKMGEMKLPMIAINRTGITRNPERLNNLHNEVKYQETSQRRNYNLYTPVPIDINYDVTVLSKNPQDIDKIMSNFLQFFNPDLFVTCIHPKYTDCVFNNQVTLQDAITIEHQDEMDGSAEDIITATFQFVYKTYIFGGPDKAKLTSYVIPKISTYISNQLSTYVEYPDNPDLSHEVSLWISVELSNVIDVIYDGFVPKINGINIGFYAIAQQKEFIPEMNRIDELSDYEPYVDRIVWKIDQASDADFPYNVGWYRLDQLCSEISANGFR